MKLAEIGEFGLISILTEDAIFNPGTVIQGVGDDAAVVKVDESKFQLMTTDMMVEDIHFSLAYSSFAEVGAKALTVNVSDIAAMGGVPTQAVVSLAIPSSLEVADLRELYKGLKAVAREQGINIVGGDTVRSPDKLIINIALNGEVEKERVLYRSGARPGDLVLVTGELGRPAAGLFVFTKPEVRGFLDAKGINLLQKAHTSPRARLRESRIMGSAGGLTSLNDISDGLASEINEICQASNVGCRLWLDKVPVCPHTRKLAAGAGIDPLEWALYGGEDFELVFTASRDQAVELVDMAEIHNFKVSIVGEILSYEKTYPRPRVWGLLPGGQRLPILPRGYNHFK